MNNGVEKIKLAGWVPCLVMIGRWPRRVAQGEQSLVETDGSEV